MITENKRTARFICLFLFSYLLFNPPLISLFNSTCMVMGIPLFYLYLFGVWVFVIFAVAMIVRN
jgi:hypothetical protein